MNWRSTSDGIMKWKSGIERNLQDFGRNIVRPTIKNILTEPGKRPQSSLRARQRAWDEGGSGRRPTK